LTACRGGGAAPPPPPPPPPPPAKQNPLKEPGGSPSSYQGVSDGHVLCLAPDLYCRAVAKLHFGPARVPSQDSPEEAIELLQERGYTACEIDFEGRFWM
jgi:hypothetical protein